MGNRKKPVKNIVSRYLDALDQQKADELSRRLSRKIDRLFRYSKEGARLFASSRRMYDGIRETGALRIHQTTQSELDKKKVSGLLASGWELRKSIIIGFRQTAVPARRLRKLRESWRRARAAYERFEYASQKGESWFLSAPTTGWERGLHNRRPGIISGRLFISFFSNTLSGVILLFAMFRARFHIPHISRKLGLLLAGVFMFFCIVSLSYETISWWSSDRIYDSADMIPKNPVGLLLGTSSMIGNQENLYFRYRIDAVRDLYASGRIDCVLVSGDNSTESYNEAKDMQNALMGEWIPPERIFLDYAGFRTLDSVVRAKEVFGQNRFTIVSQAFHLERAIWVAKHFGIDAVGYAARDLPLSRGLRTTIREVGARLALYYDLYIADTAPKFLGEPVKIPMDATERPVPEKICSPR